MPEDSLFDVRSKRIITAFNVYNCIKEQKQTHRLCYICSLSSFVILTICTGFQMKVLSLYLGAIFGRILGLDYRELIFRELILRILWYNEVVLGLNKDV